MLHTPAKDPLKNSRPLRPESQRNRIPPRFIRNAPLTQRKSCSNQQLWLGSSFWVVPARERQLWRGSLANVCMRPSFAWIRSGDPTAEAKTLRLSEPYSSRRTLASNGSAMATLPRPLSILDCRAPLSLFGWSAQNCPAGGGPSSASSNGTGNTK